MQVEGNGAETGSAAIKNTEPVQPLPLVNEATRPAAPLASIVPEPPSAQCNGVDVDQEYADAEMLQQLADLQQQVRQPVISDSMLF